MGKISVGRRVKIQRSNDRIHEALISKVNESGKSVTVEWYERGETKGKEISVHAILALNPHLIQTPNAPQFLEQQYTLEPKNAVIDLAHHTNHVTMNTTNVLSSSVLSKHSENITPPPIQGIVHSQNTHNATRLVAGAGGGIRTSVGKSSSTPTAAVEPGTSTRRPNTVKQAEQIKENREKRCASPAKVKESNKALTNRASGKNWETAQMICEYRSSLEFNPLVHGQVCEDHRITVCVRKRPLSRKEVARNEIDVISVPRKDALIVHEARCKVDLTKYLENHEFRFDYVFDDGCDNSMVYKYTAKPLVQTIFDGGMATCFAYGQTGSGKTHTMGGQFNGKVQDCQNGIYAMATKDVFAYLKCPHYRKLNLIVSASFFEIYGGKPFDLLADKKQLRVLEDGNQQVQVVDLTEKAVYSVEDVLKLIQHGNKERTSGKTSANANSSRSHAIFQIVLRLPDSGKIHGKFSIIDLAGNERGADTLSADRGTRMEGSEINKSLLALKECIRSLGKQSTHLPFRVSKLTHVLRDSFIGEKSKTCMIAMISPGLGSCEHTLNTLRYADRVKELKPCVEHVTMEGEEDITETTDSDSTLLGSLNEHDMSDEVLVHQAATSDLQKSKAEVVEHHKMMNDFMSRILRQSCRLYQDINFNDCNQIEYCKRGELIFDQLAEYAATGRDMMAKFRGKLEKEDMLPGAMKPKGGKR